jgi:hypothetical protein
MYVKLRNKIYYLKFIHAKIQLFTSSDIFTSIVLSCTIKVRILRIIYKQIKI